MIAGLVVLIAFTLALLVGTVLFAKWALTDLDLRRASATRKRLIRQTHEADPPELCLPDPDWDKALRDELA